MHKRLDDLTAQFVRGILSYNPETGEFIWRRRNAQSVQIGDVAGCAKPNGGNVVIKIGGRGYLAPRLAWLIMTGDWPSHDVDHQDLNKHNNAWKNLRAATRSQNCCNKRVRPDCLSGIKGVHWFSVRRKWRSDIMVNGRRIFLGSFSDKESAAAAYAEAAKKYHGEFARVA